MFGILTLLLVMDKNPTLTEAYSSNCPNVPSTNYVWYSFPTTQQPWENEECFYPNYSVVFPLRPLLPRSGTVIPYSRGDIVALSPNGLAQSEDGRLIGSNCYFARAFVGGTVYDSSGQSIVNPFAWSLPGSYCPNAIGGPPASLPSIPPAPPPPPPPPPPSQAGCTASEEHFRPSWGSIWYPGRFVPGMIEVHVWWPGWPERKVLLESWQRPGFRDGGGSAWTWPSGCENQARQAFYNNATWIPIVTLDQLRSEGRVVG